MSDPQVASALIGSGTTIFCITAVWAVRGIASSIKSNHGNGNGKAPVTSISHIAPCEDLKELQRSHNKLMTIATETHTDVKWLKDNTEERVDSQVLSQILRELRRLHIKKEEVDDD